MENNTMEERIAAWVARSKSGMIAVYGSKPEKTRSGSLISKGDLFFCLEDNLFPQVKWEDEEPTKVELTIKIK